MQKTQTLRMYTGENRRLYVTVTSCDELPFQITDEIIHAFLYESGMWNNSGSTNCWGMDETITDWIAIQSPKLFRTFKEADCL